MNLSIPTLTTARLQLRPFTLADAPSVERLAGAFAIADTTLNIPHPYPEGAGAQWIATHAEAAQRGGGLTWAITARAGTELYGAISLMPVPHHQRSELGYWMGQPYWGHGYTSEAAAAVLAHGFTTLALNRIHAYHFARNPASGRVMQKIGMRHEGMLRQHVRKGEHFEDIVCYAILRTDWLARK
jgi:[ribosomal protein S5]-alanine N-acetyltransferase